MKYKRAVIAMKAYPFHKGHEFLIQTALNECEAVTVLNTWRHDENPRGETRANWIRKTFPTVDVRTIVDLAMPNDGDDSSSRFWAVYAQDIMQGTYFDVVYSSEDYGDMWAKCMGVPHRKVDQARTYLPISGTAIRSDPHLYWTYINEHARQWYLKRVLIVGPESTGKTTMCRNLSLKYGTVYAPEYGRIYDEQTREPRAEFDPARYRGIYANIVNEQPKLNARAEADARNVCFYDTDLKTTAMWYEEWQPEYGHDALYWSIIDAAKNQPKFDVVIIMPMAPFVDDGMRGQTQEVREKFYTQLMKDHKDEPWKVLEGTTWEQKEAEAISIINGLFANSKVTLPHV